ncbi:uncharacterized protein LOC144628044 isoform X2 [Oculina patagonica]
MKPFQALGRLLLVILLLNGSVECRPIQAPNNIGSSVINNRKTSAGEYFVQDGPLNVQGFRSKPGSEYNTQNGNNNLESHRITRDASRLQRSVIQHVDDEKLEVPNTSSQDQQHMKSADARQQKANKNPTEGVKIEIIERPKELRVFVNKSPMQKQSLKDKDKKELKQLQREIMNKAKPKNTDGVTLKKDWDAKFTAENEMYSDDDDELSSSGENGRGDTLNFHDISHEETFLSRDQAQHKLAKDRHAHQKKKVNSSQRPDFGGSGILWSLVVIAFVLAVISIVFLRRSCCLEKVPEVEPGSAKKRNSRKSLTSDQSALKEARIKVGMRKSQENRKVLRRLSADKGASTVKEELAIACSVICPDIDTRRKNSGALHTRACIRAATSHSRRDSSFQEDLQKARGEFVNAPARFAKLVSLAGDEKENKTVQDSDSEAIKSSDSPVDINP